MQSRDLHNNWEKNSPWSYIRPHLLLWGICEASTILKFNFVIFGQVESWRRLGSWSGEACLWNATYVSDDPRSLSAAISSSEVTWSRGRQKATLRTAQCSGEDDIWTFLWRKTYALHMIYANEHSWLCGMLSSLEIGHRLEKFKRFSVER